MDKKQFSCRISNVNFEFLKEISIKKQIYHPAYVNIPNISKTLDIIITKLRELPIEEIEQFMFLNKEL